MSFETALTLLCLAVLGRHVLGAWSAYRYRRTLWGAPSWRKRLARWFRVRMHGEPLERFSETAEGLDRFLGPPR